MKIFWRILALLLLIGIILGAPMAVRRADELESGMPQQVSWNGAVRCGVIGSFPTVSLNHWLRVCFSAFAAQENGRVLVSLEEMTKIGLEKAEAAHTLPDVLFFGLNVIENPGEMLESLSAPPEVREELQGVGEGFAVPIALGGYMLMGNRQLLDAVGWSPELNLEQTVALLRQNDLAFAAPQMTYTAPVRVLQSLDGADNAQITADRSHTRLWADFILDEGYAFYVATQREICRMEALREMGKGFETVLYLPGKMYSDQVLMMGVVRPELTARQTETEQRRACIERLQGYLLDEEVQNGIGQAKLFPVTETEPVYEEGTPLSQMEHALQKGLVLPWNAANS